MLGERSSSSILGNEVLIIRSRSVSVSEVEARLVRARRDSKAGRRLWVSASGSRISRARRGERAVLAGRVALKTWVGFTDMLWFGLSVLLCVEDGQVVGLDLQNSC